MKNKIGFKELSTILKLGIIGGLSLLVFGIVNIILSIIFTIRIL